ncbi:MAG: TIGR01440 family protein [Bacillota bacterium]|nr:TIGR01440 family protein [Bacillota bacterium]
MLFAKISADTEKAARDLLARASLRPGQIFVLGCSTSEVQGKVIGKGTSMDVAVAILKPLLKVMKENELHLAVQCCEHLNRALVVEAALAEEYEDDIVQVYPVPGAGGAAAAMAMELFSEPVLLERIRAHAGMDIGQTLIGMHLRPVVVPVRLSIERIGSAILTAARTRPKLIGGNRAAYCKPGSLPPGPEK